LENLKIAVEKDILKKIMENTVSEFNRLN